MDIDIHTSMAWLRWGLMTPGSGPPLSETRPRLCWVLHVPRWIRVLLYWSLHRHLVLKDLILHSQETCKEIRPREVQLHFSAGPEKTKMPCLRICSANSHARGRGREPSPDQPIEHLNHSTSLPRSLTWRVSVFFLKDRHSCSACLRVGRAASRHFSAHPQHFP